MTHLAILGAGNMASALALNLAGQGREVRLYCIEPDVETDINANQCNAKYLAGVTLPRHVKALADIAATVSGAEIVFIAVPSFAVAEVIQKAKPFLHQNVVLASITKGLDPRTLEPLVLTQARLLPPRLRSRLCTLGGPAVANEMAKGSPTAFIAAGPNKEAARRVKQAMETTQVKVMTSTDRKGVGLASALKNPYAIALGMCDGLKYPTNAKAFVATLAIQEMAAILKAAGAKPETVLGLAGIGDLIVTGFSPHGRNRTYGERLVQATSKDPQTLGLGTVEGIAATALAVKLARRLRVQTPLLSAIQHCLQAREKYERPLIQFLEKVKV